MLCRASRRLDVGPPSLDGSTADREVARSSPTTRSPLIPECFGRCDDARGSSLSLLHSEPQPVTHGAPCQELARRASRSPLERKRIAEHRPAALGLLLSRLVLDDVPVFDEDTVLDPED